MKHMVVRTKQLIISLYSVTTVPEHAPLSFLFPQLYTLSMMPYGMEYPFGQLGSAVPAVSPPSFLCPPALWCEAGWCEKQGRLWLCKHCSAGMKTFLYYQHCFQHKSKTEPILATMKEINSILTKTSTKISDAFEAKALR